MILTPNAKRCKAIGSMCAANITVLDHKTSKTVFYLKNQHEKTS